MALYNIKSTEKQFVQKYREAIKQTKKTETKRKRKEKAILGINTSYYVYIQSPNNGK